MQTHSLAWLVLQVAWPALQVALNAQICLALQALALKAPRWAKQAVVLKDVCLAPLVLLVLLAPLAVQVAVKKHVKSVVYAV